MTATVQEVVFTLKPDLSGYRWYWPNGSPTDIWRETVHDAQRAMAFNGLSLVKKRCCPVCGFDRKRHLFTQAFERVEGIHLLDGYDVVACEHCGACFADEVPPQSVFDAYYRDLSKYEYQHRGGEGSTFDALRFERI